MGGAGTSTNTTAPSLRTVSVSKTTGCVAPYLLDYGIGPDPLREVRPASSPPLLVEEQPLSTDANGAGDGDPRISCRSTLVLPSLIGAEEERTWLQHATTSSPV
jgi:hypothetical protein